MMGSLIWMIVVGFWATADWEVKDPSGEPSPLKWKVRLFFVGVKLLLLWYWVILLKDYCLT